jgi:hypothetical protein
MAANTLSSEDASRYAVRNALLSNSQNPYGLNRSIITPSFALNASSGLEYQWIEKFSVQMRGMNAIAYFPDRTIENSDAIFNNLGLGLFDNIDEAQAFGFEFGQESFQYYTIANNVFTSQESIAWAGASYRYRFAPIFSDLSVRPFGQLFLGGTESGPMSKGILGLSFTPDSRVSLFVGLEASMLMFQNQGVWNATEKLGFMYSMDIRF